MSDLEPYGVAQHIEYDEYSVIFDGPWGHGAALPGIDVQSALDAFHKQFDERAYRGMQMPKILGIQRQHLSKDYSAPEVIDWTPPGTERSDARDG